MTERITLEKDKFLEIAAEGGVAPTLRIHQYDRTWIIEEMKMRTDGPVWQTATIIKYNKGF